MKTIGETRRDNLIMLIERHGSIANVNELLLLPRTDATLSQIKNQSLSATGRPRMMGDTLARRIESALRLPSGWMDNDHPEPGERQHRIDHALKVMEQMADYQLDQAIKIIDALAEPPSKKGNGTTGN